MKLEKIQLENFRQYYGQQRLFFAKDSQKNVTVIHGVNGAGKTSLFLAINWCLYGKSDGDNKIINNVGELISKELISKTDSNEEIQTSVELSFIHDGERYLMKRTLDGVKLDDGTVKTEEIEHLTMMRIRPDGQAERVRNPFGTMSSILPSNAREYFLFDGEKIDNFSKPESSSQVRDAIYLVLKLEVLDRSQRHLGSIAKEYRRELASISSEELRDLLENVETARSERDTSNKRISQRREEISSARNKIEEIDQRLRKMEKTKILQEQRDRVEQELFQKRQELNTCITKIFNFTTEGYFVIANPFIKSALEILDEKRDRGEIPSSIRKQFVEDLIEQMQCICGRKFAEGDNAHQKLLILLENSVPGTLEDDVLDTSGNLRQINDRALVHSNNIDEEMVRRVRLVDQISALADELDDIGRQLKGSPLEEISGLEKNREEYLADIDSYNIEIGSLKERIDMLTQNINDLEKDIAKAEKDEEKEDILSKKIELTQKAADAINVMYQTFADDMRLKIENKTKNIFKKLVWKESHFQDIQLDSDYQLKVIDRYGMSAKPELSAGERQVLSLSFITAMSRVSEEETPLVMDTPFGRLSSAHRNSIAKNLPELADQLVLFVTDEELRGQARENLESKVGKEYRLEFNSSTSCTEIIEVM